MHYKIPTISETGIVITAARKLLEQVEGSVPSTKCKIRHTKVLQHLIMMMNSELPPRVDTSAPQRVVQASSSLDNIISPRVIKGTKYVHQLVTLNNTPMLTIIEIKEPPIDYEATGNTNNQGR